MDQQITALPKTVGDGAPGHITIGIFDGRNLLSAVAMSTSHCFARLSFEVHTCEHEVGGKSVLISEDDAILEGAAADFLFPLLSISLSALPYAL